MNFVPLRSVIVGADIIFAEFTAFYDQAYLATLPPMPKTLAEGLDAIEKDREWAERALGKDILKWHLLNRRHEMEHFGSMTAAERKKEMVQLF